VLEAFAILVLLDSNVLISASLRGDHKFLEFWRMRGVSPATSRYAIGEARRHLLTDVQQARFDGLLLKTRLVAEATDQVIPSSIELPIKDRPILSAAIAGRVDFLVTGDKKHFGRYYDTPVAGVTAISPPDFLERNAYRLIL